jgi:nicotinamide mononucleotide transporter
VIELDLEAWGVTFGIVAVWLMVRQNVWAWPIGIVNVAIYIVVFLRAKLYADMTLQGIYVVLSVYGWYHWLHPGPDRPELPVGRISRLEAALLTLVTAVAAPSLGWFLAARTDAALPYWDAGTFVTSLAAQWLQTRKILENWYVWIGTDLVMIGMYVAKRLYPTVGLYAVFTALAVAGLVSWRRSFAKPSA